MNRRLPVLLGALAFASLLGASNAAEAGHAHFHFGGGFGGSVHVGGSFHWSRPAYTPYRYHVSGSIYVGPNYGYYPRPYYVYYPTYVPSYYSTTSYYPVEASYGGPSTAVVVVPRAPLPRFGVGLFGGGSAVSSTDGGSANQSDDMGLLARFRLTPGLIVEGELGKMSYDVDGIDNVRVDRRIGASLLYEIGAYNSWAPYVLVGTGVQQASVGGDYNTTQDYGEIGAGLRWAVTRQFHLAFDLRAGTRNSVANDSNTTQVMGTPTGTTARTVTPPTADSNVSEDYTRARLSAILYF